MERIRRWIGIARRISRFLQPMGIPLHSAHTCFFLVLSLFPSLLLLLGLLKFTGIGVADLLLFLEGMFPQALQPVAQSLIKASYAGSSGALISVSAVAALWSASRGMYGILSGLHAVYGAQTRQSYWRKRIISVLYTFLFLMVLLLTLIAHIFGTAILDYLWMTTDPAVMMLMNLIDLRFILLLLLQTGLFTVMYALLSGQRRRLRDCFPGAVVASLGWLLFTRLFSLYVEYFTTYSNIYGSVYALALGMLWLYFCISILFYGSVLNCILEEKAK